MYVHKNQLIQKALLKHGEIFPCNNKADLYDCFTLEENHLIFWYNLSSKTTCTEILDITDLGE
jgi:hypothetical protein